MNNAFRKPQKRSDIYAEVTVATRATVLSNEVQLTSMLNSSASLPLHPSALLCGMDRSIPYSIQFQSPSAQNFSEYDGFICAISNPEAGGTGRSHSPRLRDHSDAPPARSRDAALQESVLYLRHSASAWSTTGLYPKLHGI